MTDADTPDGLTDEQEARLWRIYLSGIGTGVATYLLNRNTAPAVAYATGSALSRIMDSDPALRHDILEGLRRVYLTGETAPSDYGLRTAYVMGHDHPHHDD